MLNVPTSESAGEMFDEYLDSSRGPVVREAEFGDFGEAVDELGAAADRIEKRLAAIEEDREDGA